jgi:hypothetical protein
MGTMSALVAKQWNLSARQRVFIALIAMVYVLAYRPWAQSSASVAASIYAGVAAMLALVLIPFKTRLVVAVGIAVGVALFVFVAGRVALGLQA